MKNRTWLLLGAVIIVGLVALPSTVSLFAGMHTYKNGSEVNNENGCRKCHEDIYEETHNVISSVHWNVPGTKGGNDVFQCSECHRVDLNISSFYSSNITEGTGGHAATTVPCLACHSKLAGLKAGGLICDSCHRGNATEFDVNKPGYDQFPMHALAFKYNVGHDAKKGKWCNQCHRGPTFKVFIELVDTKLTNDSEAHGYYYNESKNQTTIKLKDANAACIGCHSRTNVSISWRRSVGLDMLITTNSSGIKVYFSVNSSYNMTNTSG